MFTNDISDLGYNVTAITALEPGSLRLLVIGVAHNLGVAPGYTDLYFSSFRAALFSSDAKFFIETSGYIPTAFYAIAKQFFYTT